FELLAEDVRRLGGKPAPLVAQDAQTMTRLEENAIGRDAELVLVNVAQGLDDGRHQIGAAPYRFGDDHVRSVGAELADLVDQVVELAAEAGAGDFLHREALRREALGVDQVFGLVVGHKADAQSLVAVMPPKPGHRGGLAGAEKAADKNET